jgi:hypothetical protein
MLSAFMSVGSNLKGGDPKIQQNQEVKIYYYSL